jgi:ATP-dependent DNA helicase RecQ
MPTGAGKSLCYQLPALLMPGITLVVSPLIALMQDQVLGLLNNGIAATFLNSTLSSSEQRSREQALLRGDYKLLYIAPERLTQAEFWPVIERLQQKHGIPRLVVDEAHCISEWGHDFRPEYRQLKQVRQQLQLIPVTALTATATDRVRGDILQQLDLQQPFQLMASFNRPNLSYGVRPKNKNTDLEIISLIRSLQSGAAIIYCQSRATTEALAHKLSQRGIKALPYHAGLTAEERQRNQDHFIRDQVQVMVATIAFGMGINKPDVRLVLHYDLPKNMEGYYQESGRAGRDSLPASCILFFNAGDRAKIEYLIAQKTDPQEQRIARQQLRQMTDYAETSLCRRKVILGYFSEILGEESCHNCDNCLDPVEFEDRTIDAQKFLSCVVRCQQRFGMKHIIDVLRGSANQKIKQLRHDHLSTYAIGQDLSVQAWQDLGRNLLHQDFMVESTDGYPTLSLTEKGWDVLKRGQGVQVPKLRTGDELQSQLSEQISLHEQDQELFQQLRQLRKRLADQQSVPPYVIFSDRTLTEMTQRKPQSLLEFARLNGVGDRKLAQYGEVFLQEIQNVSSPQSSKISPGNHASTATPIPSAIPIFDPQHSSSAGTPSAPPPAPISPALDPSEISSTCLQTLQLHQQGLSIDAIAKQRQLSRGTIATHLTELLAQGADVDLDSLVPPCRQRRIFRAMYDQHSYTSLTCLREALGEEFTYEEIRLVRAALFQQP